MGMVSYFDNAKKVEEAHVEVCPSFDWSISHVDVGKRI